MSGVAFMEGCPHVRGGLYEGGSTVIHVKPSVLN